MSDKPYNKIPGKSDDLAVNLLTRAQILILRLSDLDIEQGRLIPHNEVMKNALDWLKSDEKK